MTHRRRVAAPRSAPAGFTLIELLVVIIIIGVLAAIAVVAFQSQMHRAMTLAHAPSPDPAPVPAPVAAQPAPSGSTGNPAGVVLAVILGILGVPLVAGTGFWSLRQFGARRQVKTLQAEQDAARQGLFTQLLARHTAVQDAWAAYREDIGALLATPALADVSVPKTAAFVDAAARAQDLRPEQCPRTGDLLDQYETAVRHLERAWTAALNHAKAVGTGMLTKQELKKVNQAVDLLAIARDSGASLNERRMAYERVTALLEGILAVPQEAFAALESAVRLAIEAAAPASA